MRERWLETLRTQGEALERRVLAAQLANLRGLEAHPQLGKLYEEYPQLASRETFERLAGALEGSAAAGEAASRRQLELLLEFVGTNLERRAAAGPVERRLALEAQLTVELDGQRWPYRSLPLLMQSCADPDRRRSLERALAIARAEVGSLHAEAHARARAAAAAAGGEDYVRWRSRLGRYDLEALASSARELLDGTDDLAREALSWLLRGRVDTSQGRPMEQHDLVYAMRATDLDGLLGASELWRVDDFFLRLGLDPDAGGRVHRDTEERPGKSPRAYCVPLEVPDEVYLVLQPAGGLPQWRALLHELGHALHHANIDPGASFEQRRLGDASLSEGFAVLFDHLLANPLWSRKVLRLSAADAERLARTAAASALLITRRQAAKLLHELAYHREEAGERALYVELVGRATGVTPPLIGHSADIDPELYCSRYLRAWMFEGLAHRVLRERYDEDWFLNPRAGARILSWFSAGYLLDLHELAERELSAGLEVAPVIARFAEMFR